MAVRLLAWGGYTVAVILFSGLGHTGPGALRSLMENKSMHTRVGKKKEKLKYVRTPRELLTWSSAGGRSSAQASGHKQRGLTTFIELQGNFSTNQLPPVSRGYHWTC